MVTADGRSATSAPVVITVGNTHAVLSGISRKTNPITLRSIGQGRVQLTIRSAKRFHVRAFDSKGRLVFSDEGQGACDRVMQSSSGFLHFVIERDGRMLRKRVAVFD